MAQPFLIDVGDLVGRPGSRRDVHISAPADFGVELSHTTGEPIEAHLTLESTSGGVVVAGKVVAPVQHRCNRCLREWPDEQSVLIRELFATRAGDGDFVIENDVIDLEPLFRDEVTLAMPMSPLCQDGCLGLCSTCGEDLNTGACSCPEAEIESPFAELRQLLEGE